MEKKAKLTIVLLILAAIIVSPFFIKAFVLEILRNSHQTNRKVLVGVWNEGFWNNQTKVLNTKMISDFEKNVNKKVAIANYFKGWDELDDPRFATELKNIHSNGWMPMVSANPYHSAKCKESAEDLYLSIAHGNCDELIHGMTKNIKVYGKPMFLRFAWEMNVDSTSWSIQSTYSTPDSFIAAWRHMHSIFVADGVTNVQWVFSVNVEKKDSIPITSLYPGDIYVDWTAIDGYNWGNTQNWSHWISFDEIFHNTYQQMVSIAPTKPLMISEFNSVADPGNKSNWMADALDVQIPNNYPKVAAIIFFNENKMESEGVDWRIETSPKVLETVKSSLSNPMYSSKVQPSYVAK